MRKKHKPAKPIWLRLSVRDRALLREAAKRARTTVVTLLKSAARQRANEILRDHDARRAEKFFEALAS
jgi:uncharacterized protein (DUF1778 family)